ncbi:MAG: phosphoribosylanthranilate isomerase [Promethearchaeota archaeon]|jgi:phosphoribosylanthranilate isomerase
MEYTKICGLKQYEHVLLCIKYGADAVGFIYNVPESPRNLQKIELKALLQKINNKISTIIVLKPSSVNETEEIIDDINASYFQIHANFDVNKLENLSKEYKKKVILALKVNRANKDSMLKLINKFKEQFFAFIIDNSEGQGKVLDFELVKEILKIHSEANLIVAGGINIENIEEIINDLKPFGIDISSSLETGEGVKDPSKIKNILIKISELKHNMNE